MNEHVSSMTDDEIIEMALVDTYGDYEHIAGFAAYLEDEVVLPLEGTIAANPVHIVGFEAQDTQVMAFVEKDGNKYPVDVMSIEFPENVIPIAAYKKWRMGW